MCSWHSFGSGVNAGAQWESECVRLAYKGVELELSLEIQIVEYLPDPSFVS